MWSVSPSASKVDGSPFRSIFTRGLDGAKQKRCYSEAVKADVRRRMGPHHRQSVAEISKELGIHVITLYIRKTTWRLQGEVVPAMAPCHGQAANRP